VSIDRFDVLIVGAGPAGSAAALSALSARPGARVGIVDRAMFPRDKVCGDGLTPAAVSALKRLGVADILTSQTPVRLWRVTGPTGHHFTAPLVPPAYVLPRRVLDAHLVAAAISRGAEFIHARVTNIERQGEHTVINGRWFARCLVGADGANSVVRARLGVSRHPARHTGVALRGYAAVASGRGLLDVRFVPGRLWPAYAWLFTAGDGSANVGVGTFGSTTRTDRRELSGILTELFPHADLDGDSVAGHRLPLSSGGAKLTAGPALLAGDAAGLVDPVDRRRCAHGAAVGLARRPRVGDRTGDSPCRLPRHDRRSPGSPPAAPADRARPGSRVSPGRWRPWSLLPNATRSWPGRRPLWRWARTPRGHGCVSPRLSFGARGGRPPTSAEVKTRVQHHEPQRSPLHGRRPVG